jgi:hypothetical protein
MRTRARRHLGSAHLLSIIAIVLALAAPAGAALVTAKTLGNNAVQSRHIRNGQVRSADIGRRAVTNRHLAIGAVKGNNLAAGSIGTVQVANGSITSADLAPGTIPAPTVIPPLQIPAGMIGAAELADGAVTNAKLTDGVVTAQKLAADSVGATAIGAGAVGAAELASGAVQVQHIGAGAVRGEALGTIVGAGVTATNVSVPQDAFDMVLADEEADGMLVPFTAELWDTAAMWNAGATATDLIVPSGGLYDVQAWVSWDQFNNGNREVQILHDDTIVAQERRVAGTGSIDSRSNQMLSTTIAAAAGNVVQLRISHSAPTATLVADRVRVTIRRVGSLS